MSVMMQADMRLHVANCCARRSLEGVVFVLRLLPHNYFPILEGMGSLAPKL